MKRNILLFFLVLIAGVLSISATKNVPVKNVTVQSASPAPGIRVSPLAVNFGTVLVGNSSQLNITITNTGTVNLTIGTISMSGNAGFSLLNNPSGQLSPNQSATLYVKFAPTSAGIATGSITIPSNAYPGKLIVICTGIAVQPLPIMLFTPLAVNCGVVQLGSASSQAVTIKNIGTANLTIESISMSGNTEFSLLNNPSGQLSPKQSATLYVKFIPTSVGLATGKITIVSDFIVYPAFGKEYIPCIGAGVKK